MMKWWHRWRYRKWEWKWLEAVGRQADIRMGEKSVLLMRATYDREDAERSMRYHATKGALDHALDGDARP